MDPISGPIAAIAQATPGLAATDLVANKAPDNLAAARFAELMAQPLAPAAGLSAPAAAAPAQAAGIPAVNASVGERILSGMQNVSGDMRTAWGDISQMLQAGERQVGIQDMLRLRETFGFEGSPIRINVRVREKRKPKGR